VFARRHDRRELDALRARAPTKRHKARAGLDLVDGIRITMDWRGWAWWRAQCAASRVGEQGGRWMMQGQSFCSIRSREEEERNYLGLAHRCSAQCGPSVLGWKSGSSKFFWWRKLGDVSIVTSTDCPGTGCYAMYPGASNPQVRPVLPCRTTSIPATSHLTPLSNTPSITIEGFPRPIVSSSPPMALAALSFFNPPLLRCRADP